MSGAGAVARWCRSAGTIAAMAVAGFVAPALVGRADAADVAPRGAVEIVVVGAVDDVEALRGSLGELLARLGLTMRLSAADDVPREPAGDAPAGVVARVQIDVRGQDDAKVALFDARAGRAPIRRTIAREGSRAVLLEDVAHVVQSAIESVVAAPSASASASASASPSASASTSTATTAPRPPLIDDGVTTPGDAASRAARRTGWSVDLATFASGASFARDAGLVFGAGVAGRGALGREPLRPALWLLGAYHFPFGNTGLPIELRVSAWTLRALPTLQLYATPRLIVEAGGGGGLDVLRVTQGATLRVMQVDADRADVSGIVTAIVAMHLRFASGSSAFAAAMLDFDLAPRDYQVADDGARRTIVHAYAARPSLALGFTFDLAGSQ